jgi:hypothetical protein
MKLHTAAVLAVLSASAFSQTLLWERFPAQPDPFYGGVVAALNDVNADGVNDIVVNSSTANNGTIQAAGYIGVLSGATGAIIWEFYGQTAFMVVKFEGVVADQNGDGVRDVWVSYVQGGAQQKFLLSGANGALISNPPLSSYPVYVPVGDLNGDTFGDFVILGQMLTAYAGPNVTTVLWSIPHGVTYGPATFTSVAPIGDINQDGRPDMLVGAAGPCGKFGSIGPGKAYIVSGANGALLQTWTGPGICDSFGSRVTSPGDLDGDGKGDAVVASPYYNAVHVFSSATGASLGTTLGVVGGSDSGLCSLGDVDGDGYGDFAHQLTNPTPYSIGVQVESGRTITPLATFTVGFTSYLGQTLAAPGDLNGDGFPDLVAGLTGSIPNGSVRAYSLAPVGVGAFGTGCTLASGLEPRIGVTGSLTPGQPLTVWLSNASPSRPAYFALGASNTAWGTSSLPMDLTPFGFGGCQLFVSVDLLVSLVTTQIRPGEGVASVGGTVPTLTGTTFYAQWGVENPPGSPQMGAFSRALSLTIQ